MADLWCDVGSGPRSTVPASTPPEAGRCLDYVVSVVPEALPHPGVHAAELVLATSDANGVFPSDHRGVCVTLATPVSNCSSTRA